MTMTYSFECHNTEDNSTTTVRFETDNVTWSGYDGPMWKFFEFLRGCGFVFHHDSMIGVMNEQGEFTGAEDWAQ